MKGETRREALLEYLRAKESASVEELAGLMQVSKMTVHRDLDRLADLRMVRKMRGGATLTQSVVFESDYSYRLRQNQAEKTLLGTRLAAFVEPGMAIILDDSTTAAGIIPALAATRPLTVISNSLPVMLAFQNAEDVTLIALGGRYDHCANAFFGLACEGTLASLRADLAVMSTAAVRGTSAYLHDPDMVRAKTAMCAAADRAVLAFDRSKVGKSALNLFSPLRDFDCVVVPDSLDAAFVAALRRDGVKLDLVSRDVPAEAGARALTHAR